MRYPLIPRVLRKLRRTTRDHLSPLTVRRLERMNKRSTRSVTGSAPVVLSLTTHGERCARVHLTIESIADGSVRPRQMILWIDDERLLNPLTPQLSRLVARGLEVRLTENLGPHTKYFPTLEIIRASDAKETDAPRLVTADDDIIYPRWWLKGLVKADRSHPDRVNCYRAHVVELDDGEILPYDDWSECWSHGETPRTFATGVSGVIYPRAMVDALAGRGTAFKGCTPRADDVWLHKVAVEEGLLVRQINIAPEHFAIAPSTQHLGLMLDNVHGQGNDPQIRATYSWDDVLAMTEKTDERTANPT
jgi:hypothetical protein